MCGDVHSVQVQKRALDILELELQAVWVLRTTQGPLQEALKCWAISPTLTLFILGFSETGFLWPSIHWAPPASDSQVLGLQVCYTTSPPANNTNSYICSWFIKTFHWLLT